MSSAKLAKIDTVMADHGSGFDQAVSELQAKGVAFEHYDMPGVTRSGDVHEAGGMKLAWFKDPDGNIISLMNM